MQQKASGCRMRSQLRQTRQTKSLSGKILEKAKRRKGMRFQDFKHPPGCLQLNQYEKNIESNDVDKRQHGQYFVVADK